jgi:hypothetical protein
MRTIKIQKNSLGDTRTATRVPTFWEFNDANTMHITDVKNMMGVIASELENRGANHDFTKKNEPHRSLFYRELCAKIEGKIDSFVDGEWYPMHCQTERHHLNERCADDVNLVDVIEMICDCICAGMARSGKVYPINISSDVLQKAVCNTVQMCMDAVEIVEG